MASLPPQVWVTEREQQRGALAFKRRVSKKKKRLLKTLSKNGIYQYRLCAFALTSKAILEISIEVYWFLQIPNCHTFWSFWKESQETNTATHRENGRKVCQCGQNKSPLFWRNGFEKISSEDQPNSHNGIHILHKNSKCFVFSEATRCNRLRPYLLDFVCVWSPKLILDSKVFLC